MMKVTQKLLQGTNVDTRISLTFKRSIYPEGRSRKGKKSKIITYHSKSKTSFNKSIKST